MTAKWLKNVNSDHKNVTYRRLFFDFSCVSISGDASNFILWLFSVAGAIIILYMILSLYRLDANSFNIMVYISFPCLRLNNACLIVWLIQREPEALLSKKVVALKRRIVRWLNANRGNVMVLGLIWHLAKIIAWYHPELPCQNKQLVYS